MVNLPVLRAVPTAGHHQATEAFKKGDVALFLSSCGGWQTQLALVFDNVPLLKERGIYEECLLTAFLYRRPISHTWSGEYLKALFDEADPKKLRDAGDPDPDQPFHEIYRVATRLELATKFYGPSWTTSLDMACWYATANRNGTPHIVSSVVTKKEILAFTNNDFQREVICWPTNVREHLLGLTEIKQNAKRVMSQLYRE